MIPKGFDCVRTKHEVQARILKEMAGLSSHQQRQKTEEDILSDPILGPIWREARRVPLPAPSTRQQR
jgi:hypothetical protein